nr:unnamed protein product [Fasciola hepatica]
MVRLNVLADALRSICNAEKLIIRFLGVMQRKGYISEFEIIDDHSVESSVLVSTCPFAIMRSGRAIYFLRVSSVLTTSSGIMDHEEAHRKHLGGKILGYFF